MLFSSLILGVKCLLCKHSTHCRSKHIEDTFTRKREMHSSPCKVDNEANAAVDSQKTGGLILRLAKNTWFQIKSKITPHV